MKKLLDRYQYLQDTIGTYGIGTDKYANHLAEMSEIERMIEQHFS